MQRDGIVKSVTGLIRPSPARSRYGSAACEGAIAGTVSGQLKEVSPFLWAAIGQVKMTTTSRYLEAPRRLRAFVRAHETSLVALAALVGVIGGLVVAAMGAAVQMLHVVLFHIDIADRALHH